jgi:hypothetical protein
MKEIMKYKIENIFVYKIIDGLKTEFKHGYFTISDFKTVLIDENLLTLFINTNKYRYNFQISIDFNQNKYLLSVYFRPFTEVKDE